MIAREWLIERVPAKQGLLPRIDAWKELSREGWELTVLVTPDRQSLIAFGWNPHPITPLDSGA